MSTPLRGLVVDDDMVFAEDAGDLLREKFDSVSHLDISFESCSTYQGARHRLQASRRRPPYDIVLVDMLFPPRVGGAVSDRSALVEYGLDVVGWAREARVPVIVGYSQESPEALARLRRHALEQGAHLFYYRSTLFGPVVTARSAVEEISALLVQQEPGHTSAPARHPADRRTVAVVYGANREAKRSLFTFLRSVNLTPVEWEQAVEWTGQGAPTVPQVLDMLFSRVQAVVVLVTPDEEVRLRDVLLSPGQNPEAGHQARPNVYFEAGIAFALHTSRTILVEVGDVRPASDLIARYAIRMDNSPEKRQALADHLETAGCEVRRFSDWFLAGDFEGCVAAVERPDDEA